MRKSSLFVLFVLALSLTAEAQYNLTFSRALIVSDQVQTVPEGKVWKVTSVYGTVFDYCVNMQTSFGILNATNSSRNDSRVNLTAFDVNGVRIYSSVEHKQLMWWTTASGCTSSGVNYSAEFKNTIVPPNPNILPMWIPAQTTVNTIASNVFLSVLEFDLD